MTTPESGETRPVPFHGRDILVQQVTDAQKLLMSREVRNVLRPDLDKTVRLNALGHTFDLLESVIVKPEDVEFLEDLILKRKIDIPDLRPLLTAFGEAEEPEEKPRARRGRPAKRTQ